jgi:hypothetical protein
VRSASRGAGTKRLDFRSRSHTRNGEHLQTQPTIALGEASVSIISGHFFLAHQKQDYVQGLTVSSQVTKYGHLHRQRFCGERAFKDQGY